MSEMHKAAEMMSGGIAAYPKFLRWAGWILIILGVLLSLTLIGAILGIPIALSGIAILFVARYFERRVPVLSGAMKEQAEIAEHALQRAREAKKAD